MVDIIKMITSVNRTVLSNKSNKYIVLHYTGNKTDKALNNAKYFKSVNRGASAHYFVDETSIYQVVEDKDSAWAVGKNYGKNNLFGICTNNNSISIEMCSTNGVISEETIKNAVDLTKMLMKKYNIPVENVVRHYDVCSKICPGWKGWVPSQGNEGALWIDFKKRLNRKEEQNKYFVQVTVDNLNIRQKPDRNSKVVGKIKDCGKYKIVKEENGWGLLKEYKENEDGWINLKYVEKV